MAKRKKKADEIRMAGQVLSNIAYNLAQDDRLPEYARQLLNDARKRWDAAIRPEPERGGEGGGR